MASDNGAFLAMYFNSYMKNEIGKPREEWTMADYDKSLFHTRSLWYWIALGLYIVLVIIFF